MPHDIESQEQIELSQHLLPPSLEKPLLGPIPPVIKSANGNVFWADESCVRRIGLTPSEARLFLSLQQGNYNYNDYSEMFHAFGEERKNLEERLEALEWWRKWGERRKMWEKRIEWLKRMDEPRLWLLYLMARRRRILKKACERLVTRMKEKRRKRLGKETKDTEDEVRALEERCLMVSAATQTVENGENEVDTSTQTNGSQAIPYASTTTQTSSPSRTPDVSRLTEPRKSTSSHHSYHSYHSQHSHTSAIPLRSSTTSTIPTHCPVFAHPLTCTPTNIRHLISSLLPPPTPYIIIGYFPTSTLDPHEKYIPLSTPSSLFAQLSRGERRLRGWKRFFSLKDISGFGLYKCDVERGAHVKVKLGEEEKMVLGRLYAAWRGREGRDVDVVRAWEGWVQKELNDSGGDEEGMNKGPLEGKWGLELVYDWCPYRLSAVVITPLVLSLVLGVWYMQAEGDVITAWTLALYIVTAAAAVVALLGIIGSLKDV